MKPRDGPDITCERRGAAELSRITRLRDYSIGGQCAHARNCCEQLSNLVRVESEFDVSLESADSYTEGDDIFAGVTRTDLTEVLQERITVTEGDCKVRMSKQRAIVKTLVAKTLKGDARSATTLLTTIFRVLDFADMATDTEHPLDEPLRLRGFESPLSTLQSL